MQHQHHDKRMGKALAMKKEHHAKFEDKVQAILRNPKFKPRRKGQTREEAARSIVGAMVKREHRR